MTTSVAPLIPSFFTSRICLSRPAARPQDQLLWNFTEELRGKPSHSFTFHNRRLAVAAIALDFSTWLYLAVSFLHAFAVNHSQVAVFFLVTMLSFWTDLVEVGVIVGRPAGCFFIIPSTHPHLRVARKFNWQFKKKLLFVRAFSACVLRLANRSQCFHLLFFGPGPVRTWVLMITPQELPRRRVDRLSPSRSTEPGHLRHRIRGRNFLRCAEPEEPEAGLGLGLVWTV